jgi:hypothetical protein
MSQSDYIRYKKISNELLEVKKLNAVLDSQSYIDFKQYYLESNITNTKPLLNQLTISGQSVIFDMSKKITNCPKRNFIMCNRTQTRQNKVLVTDHRTEAYPVNQSFVKKIIPK